MSEKIQDFHVSIELKQRHKLGFKVEKVSKTFKFNSKTYKIFAKFSYTGKYQDYDFYGERDDGDDHPVYSYAYLLYNNDDGWELWSEKHLEKPLEKFKQHHKWVELNLQKFSEIEKAINSFTGGKYRKRNIHRSRKYKKSRRSKKHTKRRR